jgi:hypothetical protein
MVSADDIEGATPSATIDVINPALMEHLVIVTLLVDQR